MFAKLFLLVIFFIIMIMIGFYSRRHATNVDSFVLGGRSVGPWLSAFAYGTSYFSAVVFIGYAGQFGWKYGLSATWIGIGNAIIGSMLAWVVLAKRTRIMSHHLHSATMPEFFEKRYDSKNLKIVGSLIVFIFLIPYTASVYNGLSKLFAVAFNIPFWVCITVMAVLTGIYVIVGGYMATAINDFIQGIIMLVGIVMVIIAVIANRGGLSSAVAQLSGISGDGIAGGSLSSIFGPDPLNLIGVIALTSLGTWGLPQMVHKFYAIKDDKSVKAGTIISTLFAIVIAGGSYFLGGFGRLFDDPSLHLPDGKVAFDGIVPLMLETALSDILIGIVVVLVLSASMSTLSALVLSSSSTLTLDLIRGNIVKKMSDQKLLLIMRVLIVFFVAISVIIALNPPVFIAQLMGISWGALAGAFLAPFLYGLYWKGVTKSAVWVSFISGVGITVSNMFLNYFNSPINAGAAAMATGLIVVPVVSLITPKLKKQKVEEVFSCYQKEKAAKN